MSVKGQGKILLADDSTFVKTGLLEGLREAGHLVTAVCDGGGAIEALRRDRACHAPISIDLLVMDLRTSDPGPYDVLGWMEDNSVMGRPPAIFIAGASESEREVARLKARGVTMLSAEKASPEDVILTAKEVLSRKPLATPPTSPPRLRVPVHIPTDYVIGSELHSGSVLNVSETGLYIKSRMTVPAGAKVHVSFTIAGSSDAGGSRHVHLKGEAVWSGGLKAETDFFRGAGIKIVDISRQDSERLKRFIGKASLQ